MKTAAGLVEAKRSLEAFFSSLSGEEKLLALSQCAAGSVRLFLSNMAAAEGIFVYYMGYNMTYKFSKLQASRIAQLF